MRTTAVFYQVKESSRVVQVNAGHRTATADRGESNTRPFGLAMRSGQQRPKGFFNDRGERPPRSCGKLLGFIKKTLVEPNGRTHMPKHIG